ncbi:MAG: SpoIVB peptidase S55 domain-containing protein [Planctomycetota bacterium]
MISIRTRCLRDSFWTLAALCLALSVRAEKAEPVYWNVDDVKPGMTGYGITVLKGTQTERFLVEVIGVLKSYSPGRDMILVRVAGLGLEKTGVMSGMSGSPVYVNEKLLGAIAFTWPFGKEPIGGITPFSQMIEYSKQVTSKEQWISDHREYLLDRPYLVAADHESGTQASISIPASSSIPQAWGGQMVRLQTPLATSSMSTAAMEELTRVLGPMGMVPVQGGAASEHILAEHMNAKIEPGGAMAVGLVTGDVSMSAIGTVTAVTGDRVHGFGHPFFGSGICEFPLQTAYIHTVIPRQTVSSKMGSAISTVGKVDADVSTCVAGWLGKSADMVPLTVHVQSNISSLDKVFKCQVVRDRLLLPP